MNKAILITSIFTAGLLASSQGTVVFSDDFESPDVSGYNIVNTSKTENTAKWVDSAQGYGSDRSGLVDDVYETSGWADLNGQQAWAGRYSSNTGVTSAEGVIGNLTVGTTITASFNSMIDTYNSGSNINAYLVTYADGATAGRDDFRGEAVGTTAILAYFSGTATSTESGYQIVYTVGDDTGKNGNTAFDSNLLGDDIAIRFEHTNGALIDDVSVDISTVPEPSAALLGGIGCLLLLRRRRRCG